MMMKTGALDSQIQQVSKTIVANNTNDTKTLRDLVQEIFTPTNEQKTSQLHVTADVTNLHKRQHSTV